VIKTIDVLPDQSIIDVVLQEYGSVEALIKFCSLNRLSPDFTLIAGQPVKIDTADIVVPSVVDFFAAKGRNIAAGVVSSVDGPMPDYIVSVVWAEQEEITVPMGEFNPEGRDIDLEFLDDGTENPAPGTIAAFVYGDPTEFIFVLIAAVPEPGINYVGTQPGKSYFITVDVVDLETREPLTRIVFRMDVVVPSLKAQYFVNHGDVINTPLFIPGVTPGHNTLPDAYTSQSFPDAYNFNTVTKQDNEHFTLVTTVLSDVPPGEYIFPAYFYDATQGLGLDYFWFRIIVLP
jgi:hypothetical protein